MCNDGQEYVRDSQSRPGVYATRSVAARVAEVHGAARAAARWIAAARRWAWGGQQPARKSARRDHSLRSSGARTRDSRSKPDPATAYGPRSRRLGVRGYGYGAGPRYRGSSSSLDGVVTLGRRRGKNARLERNNESDRAHARAPAVAVRRGRRRPHDPYAPTTRRGSRETGRGPQGKDWAAGPENARAATQPKSEQGVHTTTKLSPRRRSRARERSREQEVPVAVVSLTNHELPCVQ